MHMKNWFAIWPTLGAVLLGLALDLAWTPGLAQSPNAGLAPAAALDRAFRDPPESARPWAYWWWLDGAASLEGITADLEAMKRQGIGGVLLFDAGEGGPDAPKGPVFMSEAWRELFSARPGRADRLGLKVGVNLCSGWNAGGTWVTPELAAKKLVWSETPLEGPGEKSMLLPAPGAGTNFYRDIAVLALPVPQDQAAPGSGMITNLEVKAGARIRQRPLVQPAG